MVRGSMFLGKPFLVHLPGEVVPLKVFGRSVCWVPDPRESVTFDSGSSQSARDGRIDGTQAGQSGRHGRHAGAGLGLPGELEEREYTTMGRSTATLQPAAAAKPTTVEARPQPREGYRDTVEAIVVAFILALVVRGFEAQAFVIPTGSMAPTLMGRHKEIACPQCGFVYAVNASEEVESQSRDSRAVHSGICVNCRYQATRSTSSPSFKGDRILVMMFPYDLPFLPGSGPPERWDVVVFRYPEEPEVSYIKRLVGSARRDDPDLPRRHLRQAARRATRSPWPASRCATRSAMQITSTTIATSPGACRTSRMAALAQQTGGWKLVEPRSQPLRDRSGRRVTSGPSCGTVISCPIPSNGTRSSTTARCRASRAPRSITDFYSYNTNMSAGRRNLARRTSSQRTKVHGCSPTGSVT